MKQQPLVEVTDNTRMTCIVHAINTSLNVVHWDIVYIYRCCTAMLTERAIILVLVGHVQWDWRRVQQSCRHLLV